MNNNQNQTKNSFTKIKVIGFGGSGCNSISRLHALQFEDIELISANTDFFSLSQHEADRKIQLGIKTTKGLGTGGDVNLGKIAAEESFKELISVIKDADLLFLTAGLGGGTGSGAIEIGARIAASYDIPTISFVTLPFSFESEKRIATAYEATINLQSFTNTLITIPNDKILNVADRKISLSNALGMADTVLLNSILGLHDLISNSGAMSIDISYILRELNQSNGVYISIGSGMGENRIQEAINRSLESDIIDVNPTKNAESVIIKLTGDISIHEVNTALELLRNETSQHTQITPIIDQAGANDDLITISILLTGLGATPAPVQFIHRELEQVEENAFIEKDLPRQNNDMLKEHDYDDVLEIPAFLRRGYNPVS